MSLKIAIGGKGGVGKTTITSLLARCLAKNQKNNVIAIDADPVAILQLAWESLKTNQSHQSQN